MNKFNVDTKEAQRILLMHKALIREQEEVKYPDEKRMSDYIEKGCLKPGVGKNDGISGDTVTKKVYYIKTLKDGNTAKFASDMTFTITDPSGKVIKKARWNCDKYMDEAAANNLEIEKLKKDRWKDKNDLKDVSIDQLNDPKLYEKHPKYDLYRSVLDSGTPSQYTQEQKDIIASYKEYDYYPKNEFPAGSIMDSDCRDISVKHPGVFPNKVLLCRDRSLNGQPPKYHDPNRNAPKTAVTTSDPTSTPSGNQQQPASDSAPAPSGNQQQPAKGQTPNEPLKGNVFELKGYAERMRNQKLEKKDCRPLAKMYYEAWRSQYQLSTADFDAIRDDMQTCVNQHNFGGGIFRKSDDYVRIMTGNEPGQGPGADPDKNGRVWLLTPRRR